ncbi:hypothetical protein HF086_001345 [Spodoptera exigua]|uniref:Gamma-tubulin complex component n=1 Tax=Spodoptera exigua TaxID=7107 RepID=A0A922SEM6_SPOEX|nr:hypothetical protein HF086_001345 [Spodoptera exigua]
MDLSSNNLSGLLQKLCAGLSLDPDGAYELAVSYLSSTGEKTRTVQDERLLCQKIQTRLTSVSSRDADKFNEYYSKLKSSFILKQRVSVLSLLLALSETPQHSESTQQLFPIPHLAVTKSSSGICGSSSSTSKSTIGSVSWGSHAPKQGSNQSFPSNNSNMAVVLQSNDRSNERTCVREAVLAATSVRSRGVSVAPRPQQALHARIAHLGFLHDRLKEFIDPSSGLMPQGLMGEGLVASIRDELTEYYRSVALLQSQSYESLQDTVHDDAGGELASCVHRFVRHGDERVAMLARRLLTALTYPLLLMLTRWLIHGEIDDRFNEFFIESRSGVPIDRMWHDKYRVREWMVPSFMSREQAAQILATGKSVVFMREACQDEPAGPSDHAQHLQALLKPHTTASGRAECGAWWEAGGLREGVAGAHGAASARLLAALTEHHHLLDHLAAHRRDELNKPATSLYVHNLTCTLEAAVRATNAQFEPPHVLARLHVNLYPNCDGRDDCGWDVFALQYRVDGPLGTLFPATCAARYRALFTQLWRVKRIEYGLHDAWREHAILQKRLKHMPEVWSVMRRVSCLRLEALRLMGALQEAGGVGAEPAWRALLAAAAARADLDALLALHHHALDRHSIHAMIHHTTQELQSYLGNVLNETLALRSFEATLHAGEYAFTAADEAQDKEKRKIFHQFLASRRADLNVWARTYRGHVTTLILKLALHSEVSLQTLAFRLDYSDFYKRGDAKLHEPLTYQHKRLSEIGLNLAKNKLIDRTKKK